MFTRVLLFGLIVFFNATPSFAQTTWRLASGYSDASFHTANLREFANDVARGTNGKLNIEVRSNNSLVKLAEIRNAVGSGTVELGEVILTGVSKEFPLAGADAVPFVVGSLNDAKRLWDLQRPALEKQLGAKGLVLLHSVPWPSQGLYSARPIVKKIDFAGARMRTYNATTVRIAELLGANPVDVPMVQVADALATGRMDSMISSAVTGVESKVWSHLKYFYEINAWTPKNAVIVNAAAFAKLPSSEQRALREASKAAEERGWKMSRTAAQEAVQALKANGVKVEAMPPNLEREFTRLGERFSREWIREAGVQAGELFTTFFLKLPNSALDAASPTAMAVNSVNSTFVLAKQ
ncbi:MAG: TRAP transporter substrate-binding protein [Casimicrobium sp.]